MKPRFIAIVPNFGSNKAIKLLSFYIHADFLRVVGGLGLRVSKLSTKVCLHREDRTLTRREGRKLRVAQLPISRGNGLRNSGGRVILRASPLSTKVGFQREGRRLKPRRRLRLAPHQYFSRCRVPLGSFFECSLYPMPDKKLCMSSIIAGFPQRKT